MDFLINPCLQGVEHTIHIPSLTVLPQKDNLLLRLVLHLSLVLAKALKLIHKIINYVPEPMVRQLHVDDSM